MALVFHISLNNNDNESKLELKTEGTMSMNDTKIIPEKISTNADKLDHTKPVMTFEMMVSRVLTGKVSVK